MIKLPRSPVPVLYIIIHGSYTSSAANIGAREIRRWHKEQGYIDIGYNFVVRRDGTVDEGRQTVYSGAHTLGEYNNNSIGVCLVGGKEKGKDKWEVNYTIRQLIAAQNLIDEIKKEHPDAKVIGHRDADSRRECPGFDAQAMFSGMSPMGF